MSMIDESRSSQARTNETAEPPASTPKVEDVSSQVGESEVLQKKKHLDALNGKPIHEVMGVPVFGKVEAWQQAKKKKTREFHPDSQGVIQGKDATPEEREIVELATKLSHKTGNIVDNKGELGPEVIDNQRRRARQIDRVQRVVNGMSDEELRHHYEKKLLRQKLKAQNVESLGVAHKPDEIDRVVSQDDLIGNEIQFGEIRREKAGEDIFWLSDTAEEQIAKLSPEAKQRLPLLAAAKYTQRRIDQAKHAAQKRVDEAVSVVSERRKARAQSVNTPSAQPPNEQKQSEVSSSTPQQAEQYHQSPPNLVVETTPDTDKDQQLKRELRAREVEIKKMITAKLKTESTFLTEVAAQTDREQEQQVFEKLVEEYNKDPIRAASNPFFQVYYGTGAWESTHISVITSTWATPDRKLEAARDLAGVRVKASQEYGSPSGGKNSGWSGGLDDTYLHPFDGGWLENNGGKKFTVREKNAATYSRHQQVAKREFQAQFEQRNTGRFLKDIVIGEKGTITLHNQEVLKGADGLPTHYILTGRGRKYQYNVRVSADLRSVDVNVQEISFK